MRRRTAELHSELPDACILHAALRCFGMASAADSYIVSF
jgi:hypothetical protein